MVSDNSMSIGIALVLRDRFTNPARQASNAINRLHGDARNLVNSNLNAVRSISGALAAAGTAMTYTMGSAISKGAKYVDTMVFLSAIAKDTGKNMEDLSRKAKQVGLDTMFSAQDVASGMQFMAMAGQTTQDIYNNIEGATYLAGATMSEIGGKGGAADILTNIMKTFRIESSEFASNKVADVLTRAVTRANTNLQDLGEAIKYAGSTTANLNASLEQTAAQVMVLGNAGIQGSMAGTALGNAYRYLARAVGKPGTKGGKALANLGLDPQQLVDAKGNLIDLGEAMMLISDAMDKADLGNVERYNMFVEILGVRGQRAGAQMSQAFKDYRYFLEELRTSSGAAEKINETRMNALGGALDQFQESFLTTAIAFSEAIAPALVPLLQTMTELMQGVVSFLETKPGSIVASIAAAAVVVGTLKAGVVFLTSSFRMLFRDGTVTFSNMASVMKSGWAGANSSAMSYANSLSYINQLTRQQRLDSLANIGNIKTLGNHTTLSRSLRYGTTKDGGRAKDMYMSNAVKQLNSPGAGVWNYDSKGRAVFNNGLMRTSNKQGQPLYYMRNQEGGYQKLSNQQGQYIANRTMFMASARQAVAASQRDAAVSGAKGAVGAKSGSIGSLFRIGSTISKPLSIITKGLGRVVGFMFGPWGMAIQMLLMFGPSIVKWLSGIFDNTGKITAELRKNLSDERKRKMDEYGYTEEDMRNMTNQLIRNIVDGSGDSNRPVTVNLTVNVDGETVTKKVVDKVNKDTNLDINAR